MGGAEFEEHGQNVAGDEEVVVGVGEGSFGQAFLRHHGRRDAPVVAEHNPVFVPGFDQLE